MDLHISISKSSKHHLSILHQRVYSSPKCSATSPQLLILVSFHLLKMARKRVKGRKALKKMRMVARVWLKQFSKMLAVAKPPGTQAKTIFLTSAPSWSQQQTKMSNWRSLSKTTAWSSNNIIQSSPQSQCLSIRARQSRWWPTSRVVSRIKARQLKP